MDKRLAHIFLFLTAAVLASCARTVYPPETRTVYIDRERIDSIYVRDSVFVHQSTSGDTVYIGIDRWHTEYRDRFHTDSIVLRDSIPYPVDVVRTEYRTPGFVRFLAVIGAAALLTLIALVLLRVRGM